MTKRQIGKKIRDARELRGYTQRDVARMIHVSQGTVAAWEQGLHAPDLMKLANIFRELGRFL
ncbi:MAG: helix-turn-helix transcriptional regulator [Oscillospiraceae bacterium]|nr:helix-turn-helix transcriptional regulator [Oscillospiraceae bacterium]